MYSTWSVSAVLALFLVLVFVIGTVLALSVVTKHDAAIECDRANTTRATLLLLVGFVLAGLVLVMQRVELGAAVKHLME